MKENENIDNYLNELFSGAESNGVDWKEFEAFGARKKRRKFIYFFIPALLLCLIYLGGSLFESNDFLSKTGEKTNQIVVDQEVSMNAGTKNQQKDKEEVPSAQDSELTLKSSRNHTYESSNLKEENADLLSALRNQSNSGVSKKATGNSSDFAVQSINSRDLQKNESNATTAFVTRQSSFSTEATLVAGGDSPLKNKSADDPSEAVISTSTSKTHENAGIELLGQNKQDSKKEKQITVLTQLDITATEKISLETADENAEASDGISGTALEMQGDENSTSQSNIIAISSENIKNDQAGQTQETALTKEEDKRLMDLLDEEATQQIDSPKIERKPWSIGLVFQTGLSNFSSEKGVATAPVHRNFEDAYKSSTALGISNKVGIRLSYKSVGGIGLNTGLSLSKSSNSFNYLYTIDDIPVWDAVQEKMNYLESPNKTEINENSTLSKTSLSIPIEIVLGKKLNDDYRIVGLIGGEYNLLLDQSGTLINPFNMSLMNISKSNSSSGNGSILFGLGVERIFNDFSISLIPIFEKQIGSTVNIELANTARNIRYVPYSIGLRLALTKNNLGIRKN